MPLSSYFHPILKGKDYFDFFHYRLVLPVLELYISEIIHYVVFCV